MRSLTWKELDQQISEQENSGDVESIGIDLSGIDKYARSHAFARTSMAAGGLPPGLLKTAGSTVDLRHWMIDRTAGHRSEADGFELDVDAVRVGDIGLRAVRSDDLGPIYEAATDPANAHRWRFRGQLVSFEHFLATFEEQVLVQMVAYEISTGRPLSLNVLFGWEPLNQVCSFGYIGLGGSASDLSFERTLGVALTFSYAFSRWPVRTIYGEIPGFNANVIEGLPQELAVEEGRLREYFFYDGQWWDKVIVAIHRESWTEYTRQYRRPK